MCKWCKWSWLVVLDTNYDRCSLHGNDYAPSRMVRRRKIKRWKKNYFFVEGSDENAAIPNDLDLAESGTSVDDAFVGKEH